MNVLKAFSALGPIDVKSIRRDELLRWLVFLPVLVALALRYLVPVLNERLLALFSFDLRPYYLLVVSVIAVSLPLMMGCIIGFLLLDQRDDHTLTALLTTPLSLANYFIYRVTTPLILSLAGIWLVVPFSGMVHLSALELLLVSLAAAPIGALFALALAAFAQNKVQGFALTKTAGVIFLPAAAAYFIPGKLQLLFGLFPTYWPAKLFWALEAGEPHAWIYFLVALMYQGALLWLLLRRFERVMHR